MRLREIMPTQVCDIECKYPTIMITIMDFLKRTISPITLHLGVTKLLVNEA